MTEAEWLANTQPVKMLPTIRGQTSNRKLRLFACACCRRLWEWMTEAAQRTKVEVAEAHADGLAGTDAWDAAFGCPDPIAFSKPFVLTSRHMLAAAAGCLGWSDAEDPDWRPNETAQAWRTETEAEFHALLVCSHASDAVGYREGKLYTPDYDLRRAATDREAAAQANLLRDIFGNPFRPVAFDAAWRTSTAVAIARGVYESRDFGAMPILADALQDAGCDSDDVLNHCRDANATHVRGCWVVDLVLDKM